MTKCEHKMVVVEPASQCLPTGERCLDCGAVRYMLRYAPTCWLPDTERPRPRAGDLRGSKGGATGAEATDDCTTKK